jgi:glycosyltransferase involved in cell wall biosynthesis
MTQPIVSILLCAYNAEAYIAEAIESTLGQTFHDYELIIVDDGSNDSTLDIIHQYQDERIKVIAAGHNYIGSLNTGLGHCHGNYIARMDADDIMEPTRIATQIELMDTHPDITVCTSWAQAFGEVEKTIGNMAEGEIEDIYTLFLLGNFLIHPTSMIRRRFLSYHRLHYKEYLYAEDFKLWTDIAHKGGRFYVIPQTLLRYRITQGQITNAHRQEQDATRLIIQQEVIEEKLRKVPSQHKPQVMRLYRQMLLSHENGYLAADAIIGVMFGIFQNLKNISKI